MFYHKLMVYRVRSSARIRGMHPRRHHPLLGLTTLSALGLCATAIYASLGGWENGTLEHRSDGVVWEFANIPPETDPSYHRKVETEADLDSIVGVTQHWRDWPVIDERSSSWVLPGASEQEHAEEAKPSESLDQQVVDAPAEVAAEEAVAAPAPKTELAENLQATNKDGSKWLEARVKSGDSISRIFGRLGLSSKLLHNIIHSDEEAAKLADVSPGEHLRVQLNDGGEFEQLVLERDALHSLQILADGDGFATSLVSKPTEMQRSQLTGVISDSLYNSAKRAGLSDGMIMELAAIFGWDIDFALEIQRGDSFAVIFEEQYVDGKKYRNGNILAAEFVNRGRHFRAVRYEMPDGYADYYTPEGRSMRKAFLRAPVDFRRISSKFNPERFHPVLGKKRPHRGVDYAAATGTPIKAAGDGRVIFRGAKGGYGNAIIIQHGERYTTLYGHMSKFQSKVENGSRVKQGDVIGYVGSSGLATGPHLHYEFRVDGVHRNPLTVELPKALPIDKQYLQDFLAKSGSVMAQLEVLSGSRLAKVD